MGLACKGFARVVQRERNGARESKVSLGRTILYPGGAGEEKGDKTCLVITRQKTSSEKHQTHF